MKAIAWVVFVLTAVGFLGMMFNPSPADAGTVMGVIYGALNLALSGMVISEHGKKTA